MKRTYMIEDKKGKITGIHASLSEAKRFVVQYYGAHYTILAMKGPYFGEGFHTHRYYLEPNKIKFKMVKL